MEVINNDLAKISNVIVMDIEQMAKDNGVPRSANVILLGAAQKALGLDYEKLENAIRRVFAKAKPLSRQISRRLLSDASNRNKND